MAGCDRLRAPGKRKLFLARDYMVGIMSLIIACLLCLISYLRGSFSPSASHKYLTPLKERNANHSLQVCSTALIFMREAVELS
jgi:hypothetical protein